MLLRVLGHPVSVCFAVLLVLAAAAQSADRMPQSPSPAGSQAPAQARVLSFCTVVLDSRQQPVTGLQPNEFNAQVNNVGRPVVSAEPGDAARTVLIIIDRDTIESGDAASARTVATAIVDGLPARDEIELVTLPSVNLKATPTVDRTALRNQVARVTGRFQEVRTATDGWQAAFDAGADSILARELRTRAAELLTAVSGFIDDLRDRNRQVVVVLLSNRVVMNNWNQPEIERTAAVAAAVRAPIYVLPLYAEQWTHGGAAAQGMRTLAEVTGGAVIPVVGNQRAAARQVLQEIAGCWLVSVPLTIADWPDKPQDLRVTLGSASATLVRAPTRLPVPSARGRLTSPFLAGSRAIWTAPALRPRDGRTASVARPAAPRAEGAPARAGQLLANCLRDFPAVAADEQVEEHVKREMPRRDVPFRDRALRSRFRLISIPSREDTWTAFRDVSDVDGVAVTDWDHNLEAALAERPKAAVDTAGAIDAQGGRFHIGSLARGTVNPMLPLLFLQDEYRTRFAFESRGQEKLDGRPAERIDYAEQVQPYLVTANRGTVRDVKSQGSFWIEPATGRVLKATIEWNEGLILKTDIAVTYQAAGPCGFPVLMKEIYSTVGADGLLLEATSRYSDFKPVAVPAK